MRKYLAHTKNQQRAIPFQGQAGHGLNMARLSQNHHRLVANTFLQAKKSKLPLKKFLDDPEAKDGHASRDNGHKIAA